MTENALSISIVIFSLQLQQTEISDKKLFVFQHGLHSAVYGTPTEVHHRYPDLSDKQTGWLRTGLEKVLISP